jgi:hypothetical protein
MRFPRPSARSSTNPQAPHVYAIRKAAGRIARRLSNKAACGPTKYR